MPWESTPKFDAEAYRKEQKRIKIQRALEAFPHCTNGELIDAHNHDDNGLNDMLASWRPEPSRGELVRIRDEIKAILELVRTLP